MASDPEAAIDLATQRFGATRLFRDAGSLASSSVASAILGIVFWTLAARLYVPERLGVMSAVLSLITAVGTVAAASVGDAYTALLPAAGSARSHIYQRGQRVWLVLALAGGIGGAFVAVLSLPQVHGSLAVGILVALGVAAWSAFLLQNSTLISLGRARWLPATNIASSLLKILLLLIFSMAVVEHSVELATVIPAAAIVLILRPVIVRTIRTGRDLPKTATIPGENAVREFNKLASQTGALALLSTGALLLTPFLVTKFAGPADGALFALCLAVVQTLDFIAAAMGVSLVVHASSSPDHGNTMARAILMRTTLLLTAGALLLIVVVPVGLRLLNPRYGELGALEVVALLSLGSVVRVSYMVWAALQKSRRRMKAPLLTNLIAAMLLFSLIPGFCSGHGALGGALAVLIQQIVLTVGAGAHFLVAGRD